jgi:hypothetical protein
MATSELQRCRPAWMTSSLGLPIGLFHPGIHLSGLEVSLIGKHGGDDHGEITRRVHERFDDDREEHI